MSMEFCILYWLRKAFCKWQSKLIWFANSETTQNSENDDQDSDDANDNQDLSENEDYEEFVVNELEQYLKGNQYNFKEISFVSLNTNKLIKILTDTNIKPIDYSQESANDNKWMADDYREVFAGKNKLSRTPPPVSYNKWLDIVINLI